MTGLPIGRHLAVAEVRAVAEQRRAAADDPRVVGRHHERADPAVLRVARDAPQVALLGLVRPPSACGSPITRRAARSPRISSTWPFSDASVPPLSAALQRLHDQRRVAELAGRLVEQEHAEVGRDRVEPAAEHDPRAGCSRRVVARDARRARTGSRPSGRSSARPAAMQASTSLIPRGQYGPTVVPPRARRSASAASDASSSTSATTSGQSTRAAASSSFSRERPASADRHAGGRVLGQVLGDQPTDEPVAPKTTMSIARLDLTCAVGSRQCRTRCTSSNVRSSAGTCSPTAR